MSEDNLVLKKIIEGAVLASAKPISFDRIAKLFEEGLQPSMPEMRAAFEALQLDYEDRGVQIQEVASGLRFQVSTEVNDWVGRLHEERPQRYSRALLETIAIIAYRQPITRGDIEEIRGVAVSSHIIKTLLEREWVRVVGHRDVPGRPAMYATTRQFLDYFDLSNLDQLPPLSEIKDLDQLNRELDLDDDLAQALKEMAEKEAEEKAAIEAGEEAADEETVASEEDTGEETASEEDTGEEERVVELVENNSEKSDSVKGDDSEGDAAEDDNSILDEYNEELTDDSFAEQEDLVEDDSVISAEESSELGPDESGETSPAELIDTH